MRADFSKKTKGTIAGRAGYKCSFPGCGRTTIGPGAKSDQVESTGVAAHIFPASPSGPRKVKGLSPAERKSPENGIWLCAEHARLIDPNNGEKYPGVLLQTYKALHEANIAREKGGIYSPIGWFQELVIEKSPIFLQATMLRFGKVTLVIGDNCTGKTALCEWLVGIGDPSVLSFWITPQRHIQLDIELEYFNPTKQSARLEVRADGLVKHRVSRNLQQDEFPFQPAPLRFIIVREPGRLLRGLNSSELDDLELICSELNVDALTVRNLFPYVDKFGSGSVRNIRTKEEDSVLQVVADLEGTKPGLSYRCLSHSEQTLVLVELAIVMARFSAEYVPTMLVVEGLWRFDKTRVQRFSDYLSQANHSFQTVIVLPEEWDISSLRWAGWVIAHLERTNKGTIIDQEM